MTIEKRTSELEPISEMATLLDVILRIATSPDADVDKMQKFLEMYERVLERNAKTAFFAAFAEMQPELPTIDRNGRIVIAKKDSGEVIQSTPYALYEDIMDAVQPILAKHGFGLGHRTGIAQDGKITVTGVLRHKYGYSEETTFTGQHDSTGSKNAVQAIGSTTQYGRRYTTLLLLNITSRSPKDPCDDDGKAAGVPMTITASQAEEITELLDETLSNSKIFLNYFNCASIKELPANKYGLAIKMLKQKQARNGR